MPFLRIVELNGVKDRSKDRNKIQKQTTVREATENRQQTTETDNRLQTQKQTTDYRVQKQTQGQKQQGQKQQGQKQQGQNTDPAKRC